MKTKTQTWHGFRIFCGNSFVDGVYAIPEWNLDEVLRIAENHEGVLCYLVADGETLLSERMIYHPNDEINQWLADDLESVKAKLQEEEN